MPSRGPRRERDRFARAVDGVDDSSPEFRTELGVVATLRRTGLRYRPDAATKARIAADISNRAARPTSAPARAARRVRFAPVLAGLVAALVAFGGFGLLLSKDALPGDALYGVKRAGEQTSLALTFDDETHARKQLGFAADRLRELGQLRPSSADAHYRTALAGFTGQAGSAVARLTGFATSSDGRALRELRDWVGAQRALLAGSPLPSAVHPDRDHALGLLDRIEQRATALGDRMRCYRITSGQQDELGALPAAGPCQPGGAGDTATQVENPGQARAEPTPPPPNQAPVPAAEQVPPLPDPRPTAVRLPPAPPLPPVPSLPAPNVTLLPRLPNSPPAPPPLLDIPLPAPLPTLRVP